MSYIKEIKHQITLTSEELFDILESRYGLEDPIDINVSMSVKTIADPHTFKRVHLQHPIVIEWKSEEVVEENVEEPDSSES